MEDGKENLFKELGELLQVEKMVHREVQDKKEFICVLEIFLKPNLMKDSRKESLCELGAKDFQE